MEEVGLDSIRARDSFMRLDEAQPQLLPHDREASDLSQEMRGLGVSPWGGETSFALSFDPENFLTGFAAEVKRNESKSFNF